MGDCIFEKVDACRRSATDKLSNCGIARIQTIIDYSKQYDDNLYKSLEELVNGSEDASNLTISAHRDCVSVYCSKTHLKRRLDYNHNEMHGLPSPLKRRRRSETPVFDFKLHCVFCGNVCLVEVDKKHPDRWIPAFQFRKVQLAGSEECSKSDLLNACRARGDKWANEVQGRVQAALSDLHAADARYHVHCRCSFMSSHHIKSAVRQSQQPCSSTSKEGQEFEYIVNVMKEDKSRIWNSVELHELYSSQTQGNLTRRVLMLKLIEHFGEDLLVLTSPGVASIVVFKNEAPGLLKLVPDSDESAIDFAIEKLAGTIKNESKAINISKKQYSTKLPDTLVEESISSTLLSFLAKLSGKLDHTLHAYLIGSIVTSDIINYPTLLQISLGVLMRSSKVLVERMFEYGVTCSYDEVKRFKKSAALSATLSPAMQGISDASGGLIQVVVDNFDADISSQNGKLSTHSLAILLTQPKKEEAASEESSTNTKTIRRVDRREMDEPIDYDFPVEHFNGPKKAKMPQDKTSKLVLPLKMLCSMSLAKTRAQSNDACFLRDVVKAPDCPEFNGYNTRESRQQNQTIRPSTKAVYLPLIDMTPSDPDTIMTAMRQAQVLTRRCGQEYTIFTGDLQLYKVAVNILWAYPEQFGDVILRLGGMHTLMSFVGSVGTLMADSGLSEILESTFGGVSKMLSGKKFPQNVRAMRIVTEELLRPLIEADIQETDTLDQMLIHITGASKTSKLWGEVFVKAVLIMMMYIRAEREADWYLHLSSVAEMIPFFFAAGHVNYARYALYYLRSMERLPEAVLKQFLKGQHVMRHISGRFNGIWSDMFIETTFMRYGHGKRGIIGITLKPETLKVWSLSLHLCSQLETELEALSEGGRPKANTHKEEMKGRIAADSSDRESIRKKLNECIHPLVPREHPDELINIVTGRVASSVVNVQDAITIGKDQINRFENGWPGSFHEAITRKVKTQAVNRKSVDIGEERSFDTELIYTRVIGMQASGRDIDLNDVLSYELAPVPTAMFEKSGKPRIEKNKSKLKEILKVEASTRQSSKNIENVVVDGSAVLYTVSWPMKGTVKDYLVKFRRNIERKLIDYNVYLVFDRYRDFSIKSATRSDRASDKPIVKTRIHKLSPDMDLPSSNEVLTIPENKKQLIALICDDLAMNITFGVKASAAPRKLVVTGENETPLEITGSINIRREDLRTSHEEADNIIVQQMINVSKETGQGVKIIADDTDVFILALYHFKKHSIKVPVIMESPVQGRTIIDINATVDAHSVLVPDLLAVHALSGCDTVPCYQGIGKGKAMKALKSKTYTLDLIGDTRANLDDVVNESTKFIASCYGLDESNTMSNARIKAWSKKAGKSAVSAPKLETLPPTTQSFRENVKRAHFQTCVWKHAVDPDPPTLDPIEYGWSKDENQKSLMPVLIAAEVPYAPQYILKIIRCSCESQTPCSSLRCRCNSSRLSCTVFCACRGEGVCCNEQTK